MAALANCRRSDVSGTGFESDVLVRRYLTFIASPSAQHRRETLRPNGRSQSEKEGVMGREDGVAAVEPAC
jgi:hypothetical protein